LSICLHGNKNEEPLDVGVERFVCPHGDSNPGLGLERATS
jgi:hypothetical protein